MSAGIDQLANTVKITLGPKGRNVVLDKKFGTPLITNDGVTIAKEIELEDPFENMGAQLVRKLPPRPTMLPATAPPPLPLLAQAIIREGMKNVAAGANPMVIKQAASRRPSTPLSRPSRQHSQTVNGSEDIARVGTVSAGDEQIGKLIADAMEKVTADGVITIEESKTAADLQRGRRRHAVRPRLRFPLHGHRYREDGSRHRRRSAS